MATRVHQSTFSLHDPGTSRISVFSREPAKLTSSGKGLDLEAPSDSRRESEFYDWPKSHAPRMADLDLGGALTLLLDDRSGPGAAGPEARVEPRSVLHRSPSRSPTRRSSTSGRPRGSSSTAAPARRRGRARSWSSSSSPARRRPGSSEFGTSLRPGQPDLQGARRGQADGRLRAPAAQGIRRPAGRGLPRDRDGIVRDPGADHAREPDRSIRPSASRSGSSPSASDPRPRPAARHARSRRRPPRSSGPPTRPLHYVLAENLAGVQEDRPGGRGTSPPGKGASAAC